MQKPDFKVLLKQNGYRSTVGRTALLETLWNEKKPLTVGELAKRLRSLDQVTLYRALESFAQKGMIRRMELGHGHAHYEMEKEHHHHVVCTDCGKVEDVTGCSLEGMDTKVAKESRSFKSIYSHNVEFFGRCNACTH